VKVKLYAFIPAAKKMQADLFSVFDINQ